MWVELARLSFSFSVLTVDKSSVSWLLLEDLSKWSVGFDHRCLHLVDESVGRFNVWPGDHGAIRGVSSGAVGPAEEVQPKG